MTGKISEDADAGSVGGSEQIPIVAGGLNKRTTPAEIAGYLASLAQTLTNKTIDAASNTLSNIAVSMFAAGVVDTDAALTANSDTKIATQKAVKAYAVSGPASSTSSNLATFNGTSGKVIQDSGVPISSLRLALTAARTYYVRTDGSDSNNGLANTAGGAFLTIQKAIDVACSIDMGVYQVTIQVGDGAYSGALVLKPYVGQLRPIIQGNTTTWANCIISATADSVSTDGVAAWQIQGFRLQNSTGAFAALRAKNGGTIYFDKIDFGAVSEAHMWATAGGKIYCLGSYSISATAGGDSIHIFASDLGYIETAGASVTVSVATNFGGSFINASRGGEAKVYNMAFSGVGAGTGSTGVRVSAASGANVYASGAAQTAFPGGSNGTTTTGYFT